MSSYWKEPKRSTELYHWGVKKGAKAEKHKYIARIPDGKGYRYFYTNAEYEAYKNGNKAKDAVGKATQGLKNIVSTGVNVVESHFRDVGWYNELREGNHPKSFDELERTKPTESPDDDMREVNPKRELNPVADVAADVIRITDPSMVSKEIANQLDSKYGRLNNCSYCTLAYDMRRKGYDVEASSVNFSTANTLDEIESWYKDAHFTTTGADYVGLTSKEASKKITKELSSEGSGARGQFCMVWTGGGGHSISYEVDNSGNVIYRDCQHDLVMKNEEINDYLKNAYLPAISHMRTDDKEFSDKALHGVVPKRRKKK